MQAPAVDFRAPARRTLVAPWLAAPRRRIHHPGTPRRGSHVKSPAAVTEVEVAATTAKPGISDAARTAAFTKIDFDQEEELRLEVEGEVPKWLRGSLYINGCGDYTGKNHMFDGLALIHKLRIGEDGIFSTHRKLRSEAYKHFENTGEIKFMEFGTRRTGQNIFTSVMDLIQNQFQVLVTTDNASVSLVPFDGKLIAASEVKTARFEIDPQTLEPVDKAVPDTDLDVITAHPLVTTEGDMINVGTQFLNGYSVVKQKKGSAKCEEIAFIPSESGSAESWIHDFPATENYLAVVETPLKYDIPSILFNYPADYGLAKWDETKYTRIHLVPLKGQGKVRTFRCPPFFAFHYTNAFESEDGSKFCFDLSLFKDPTIIQDLMLDNLLQGNGDISESSLCRIELPLKGASRFVKPEPLLDPQLHGGFCDFPSVNSRFQGAENRYLYMTGIRRPSCGQNALVKVDLKSRTCKMWHQPGCFVGEPIFVEAPNARSEDDGVIVTTVILADGNTAFVILDAASWEELAIAKLPYGIPTRFHGRFVKD